MQGRAELRRFLLEEGGDILLLFIAWLFRSMLTGGRREWLSHRRRLTVGGEDGKNVPDGGWWKLGCETV